MNASHVQELATQIHGLRKAVGWLLGELERRRREAIPRRRARIVTPEPSRWGGAA